MPCGLAGACVDGIVGDCGGFQIGAGEGGCEVDGYGEISFAAARAIGVYMGPEELNEDPLVITIGIAPDPATCRAAGSGGGGGGH